MTHKVTEKVDFLCSNCGRDQLISGGAARTDDDRLWLVFACGACEEPVFFDIEHVIAELYKVPLVRDKNWQRGN